MKRKLKILIGAGGTGGHLFPAIAVCEQLEELTDKNCEFHFIGNKNKIESRVVPSCGYYFHPIKLQGLSKSFKIFLLPFQITKAISICRKIIDEYAIDAVIATGAYLSIPPVYAAHLMRKPIFLLESNVNPGKAIKALAKFASKIYISFDESKNYFNENIQSKILKTGNPIRKQFFKIQSKEEARRKLNIPLNKTCIFVFGGSLGALSINKAIEQNMDYFIKKDYFLIWQTGKNYTYQTKNENIIVKEFIDDISLYYTAADLVICRSGATTIAELAIAGKPAVLIPLPSASNNEQYHNAKVLSNAGAAEIILNDELEEKLLLTLDNILADNKLNIMEANIKKFAHSNAAKDVANDILKTIFGDQNGRK